MGLLIGGGFYEAAIIMCAFLFAVIVTLNRLDEKYLKDSTTLRLYIEYTADTPFSAILGTLRRSHWHMSHLECPGGVCQSVNSAIIDIQRNGLDSNREMLLESLRSTDGVLFVEDA